MDYAAESLKKHAEWQGKIEVKTRVELKDREDLSIAYTPGVAQPCLEIQKDPAKSFTLTRRWNTCFVITDGTAVLGLGDIGPEAGMPVMEGKCALFKAFADVDAIPLCIRSKDVDELVRTIYLISGSCGGINLEDISAPRCFEVESRLKEICDVPIFHDDQHGTAVVALAGVLNALKVVHKKIDEIKVVISGAGAAGLSIAKMLLAAGITDLSMNDKFGPLYVGRKEGMNPYLEDMAKKTNKRGITTNLADLMVGADLFIGVSAPGIVSKDMVRSMAKDAIVFACANPKPEIFPEEAKEAGAAVVASGRSDYPNQINNLLVFPGIFRGALDARASDINEEMKLAASMAIAGIIKDEDVSAENIIPSALNPEVAKAVAKAVAEAAKASGVARI